MIRITIIAITTFALGVASLAGVHHYTQVSASSRVAADDTPITQGIIDGCNVGVARPLATIDVPGIAIPVHDGDLIEYRLLVDFPSDLSEVGCVMSNVAAYVRVPGSNNYEKACHFDLLFEGQRLECPSRVPYVADAQDAMDGLLWAQVRVIADVVGNGTGCVVPERHRNPKKVSECLDATALSTIPLQSQ